MLVWPLALQSLPSNFLHMDADSDNDLVELKGGRSGYFGRSLGIPKLGTLGTGFEAVRSAVRRSVQGKRHAPHDTSKAKEEADSRAREQFQVRSADVTCSFDASGINVICNFTIDAACPPGFEVCVVGSVKPLGAEVT